MKLLLFGCNGQVGWELQRSLAPLGELIALGRNGDNNLRGDLTRLDELARTVQTVRPDIIINAAIRLKQKIAVFGLVGQAGSVVFGSGCDANE